MLSKYGTKGEIGSDNFMMIPNAVLIHGLWFGLFSRAILWTGWSVISGRGSGGLRFHSTGPPLPREPHRTVRSYYDRANKRPFGEIMRLLSSSFPILLALPIHSTRFLPANSFDSFQLAHFLWFLQLLRSSFPFFLIASSASFQRRPCSGSPATTGRRLIYLQIIQFLHYQKPRRRSPHNGGSAFVWASETREQNAAIKMMMISQWRPVHFLARNRFIVRMQDELCSRPANSQSSRASLTSRRTAYSLESDPGMPTVRLVRSIRKTPEAVGKWNRHGDNTNDPEWWRHTNCVSR